MKQYQVLLTKALVNAGWEVVSIEIGPYFSVEEFWKIRSLRKNRGLELVLTFDSFGAGEDIRDTKGKVVCEIYATSNVPDNYEEGRTDPIASLPLQKGLFDIQLARFIQDIDAFRDGA